MFSENQSSALCQESNVLVDFTRKSLFLVDIPSNSLPPLEEIQKIIVQIFILLTI